MARSAPLRFCRSAARLSLYVLAVVVLVLAPSFVLAQLFAWCGVAEDALPNLVLGLVCSLVAWLFITIFHLSREKLVVPVPDRQTCLAQVRILLDEMGYEVTAQSPDGLHARPRFHALLFGGGMRIALRDSQVHIHGPKLSAEILRNRLRMEQHILRMHAMLQDDRKSAEPLLKRVELRLRVKPNQMEEVRAGVLDLLAPSGDVVCDVHVLVQSEQGIRESTIEQKVRTWARSHDIDCDVHKHHARYLEPTLQPQRVAAEIPA